MDSHMEQLRQLVRLNTASRSSYGKRMRASGARESRNIEDRRGQLPPMPGHYAKPTKSKKPADVQPDAAVAASMIAKWQRHRERVAAVTGDLQSRIFDARSRDVGNGHFSSTPKADKVFQARVDGFGHVDASVTKRLNAPGRLMAEASELSRPQEMHRRLAADAAATRRSFANGRTPTASPLLQSWRRTVHGRAQTMHRSPQAMARLQMGR